MRTYDITQPEGQLAAKTSSSEATRTGNLSAININIITRTKGGWNAAHQLVAGEMQIRQSGQATKLGWNRTRQFVVLETPSRQLGQDTKLGWNRTRQFVGVELQLIQLGQESKLGWN